MNDATVKRERPVVFRCEDHELLGILHPAEEPARRAVVLVVGGPQYRVGSHRQFVLLARTLAASGWPVLRFDYRGMGDSEGDLRDFEDISADIAAAIDATFASLDGVRECVLWGLCDAASAAAFYSRRDERVTGMVLVNPWVRTEAGEARTRLRHYYLGRLRQRDFWRKLLHLRWNPFRTLSDVGRFAARSRGGHVTNTASNGARPLPERMFIGLQAFDGQVLLILSGHDLTAREFEDVVAASAAWQRWIETDRVETHRLSEADHTFSRSEWRAQVADWTQEWLQSW